jgi:hypothetical protein
MFNELIEKIRVLKKRKRLYGWGHISVRKQGYNEGVEDVIRVITKSIPQPQDKPDSEGWWWLINPELDDIPMPLYINTNAQGILLISNTKGKWYKAILPEVQNETTMVRQ